MTCIIPLILTLLTPFTVPVSGGRATEFRRVLGLVPWDGWTEVSGLPFSSGETFTEITYAGGNEETFRILSSGATAGLHASIGSQVTQESYWGYLGVSGFSVTVCDFNGRCTATHWKGFTLDYRETGGLFGEYRGESLLLAGGANSYTAGVSPELSDNLRFGPAWRQDSRGGRFMVQGEFSRGCLLVETGGAVLDDRAVHRTKAEIRSGSSVASAVYDGTHYLATAGLDPLCILQWPDWGISSVITQRHSILLCLSHCQGGRFQGELQLRIEGITGGINISRLSRGVFEGGFTLGVDF